MAFIIEEWMNKRELTDGSARGSCAKNCLIAVTEFIWRVNVALLLVHTTLLHFIGAIPFPVFSIIASLLITTSEAKISDWLDNLLLNNFRLKHSMSKDLRGLCLFI